MEGSETFKWSSNLTVKCPITYRPHSVIKAWQTIASDRLEARYYSRPTAPACAASNKATTFITKTLGLILADSGSGKKSVAIRIGTRRLYVS